MTVPHGRASGRVFARESHPAGSVAIEHAARRRWASGSLLLAGVLLAAPAQTARAAAELVLDKSFAACALRNMPCSPSPAGMRFLLREHVPRRAFEWQVRLRMPLEGQPRPYEHLRSADFVVKFPVTRPVVIHWNKGSHASASDFQPLSQTLKIGSSASFESFGGRSSDGVLPYFNLATRGGGLIVAIGWSGDWKVSFERDAGSGVHIAFGLKKSRFRLMPGEEVRLPSVLVLSYRGSWIDGQNQFRRLMLREFTPRTASPMREMPVAASVHGMYGFNETTEKNVADLAARIASSRLPLDTFWLDAGWSQGGFPGGQGNPAADPTRFPRGLRHVGDSVRKAGMRFLVWFEPERVMRGTWLDRKHPDWLMLPERTPPELRYLEADGFRLLDLGNTAARSWAVETISHHIAQWGISIYRQDCNLYPSFFWHTGEAREDVGLREVRYITGLYEFLDELARRHPQLILDNCASGGRRLDFEMMRRCVALWRSDSCWDDPSFPRNAQAMTYGLSLWLPLHGLGSHTTDNVALRSGMGACATFPIDFGSPDAVAALRSHLERYLPARRLFTADFYPLSDWSLDPARWLAFEFHDPARGQGIVQAFCGPGTKSRQFRLVLRGLDPVRQYRVTNWDEPDRTARSSGLELMRTGIEVQAGEQARAVVLQFSSVP